MQRTTLDETDYTTILVGLVGSLKAPFLAQKIIDF